MLVLNLLNYMVHIFTTISFMYYIICIRIFDIIFFYTPDSGLRHPANILPFPHP
jgi:hypothetical protein